MDRPVIVGTESGLNFAVTFEGDPKAIRAADASWGRIVANVGKRVAWGIQKGSTSEGIQWSWVELLEHLATHWMRLTVEETDPLGLNEYPADLRSAAEKRWLAYSTGQREQEEIILWSFEEAHNLAAGLQGIDLQSIWFLREGNNAHISGNGATILMPYMDAIKTLEDLGTLIANRLSQCNDERARIAIATWGKRNTTDVNTLVRVYTGFPTKRIAELGQGNVLKELLEVDRTFVPNEILAAARMTYGFLTNKETVNLLRKVKKIRKLDTSKVDGISAIVRPSIDENDKPFEQGFSAARALRQHLGNRDSRISPEDILDSWGIQVTEIDVFNSGLDAVCCWGPNHGPAILVNKNGRHANQARGYRSTLAHEICHLLLDRDGSLPLGEALGGNSPKSTESRANAFAAEFLLPQSEAIAEFAASKSAAEALSKLTRSFNVSWEIAAWQVLNSGYDLSHDARTVLQARVNPLSPSLEIFNRYSA